jgi:hypothetical protein
VGRPSRVIRYKDFLDQAVFWEMARRAVAKGGYFGELFPRVGCIVKNLSLPSRGVALFYTSGVQRSNRSK